MASSHTPAVQEILKQPRKFGAIFFLFGTGILYWRIILPIQQARSAAAQIDISVLMTMVGVAFTLMGLIYLVFGLRFASVVHPSEEQSKVPARIAGAVVVLLGLAIYYGLKTFLVARGYIFQR